MRDYAWPADSFDHITSIAWCTGAGVDDVLAAYRASQETVTASTFEAACVAANELLFDQKNSAALVFFGALGDGIVVMEPNRCMSDTVLARLSQTGKCLSVAWSDFVPPVVTYLERGQVVVTFDGIAWEYDATPDVETVERWMATTSGGVEEWQANYGTASLMAGEALVGAAFDEQWLAREHACVTIGG
ncbi:DUF6461 domain-containing protein [Sphaerisporangium fuscum]|uniref:DUF6461 domain-containing protein n=1 Tax=Sphaerisporangium fuscum TaxID=2835868 RepID=UPI001BDC8902|nr:DUF6461 domain-containing protein [Sphaerisporangium fuscum]